VVSCTTIHENVVFLARFHRSRGSLARALMQMHEKEIWRLWGIMGIVELLVTLHPSPLSPLIPISPFLTPFHVSIFWLRLCRAVPIARTVMSFMRNHDRKCYYRK
jgi:hypothetical protein